MDEETKNRIIDYFDTWELAEFLTGRITIEAFVEAFEEEIEEALDEIEELMEFSRG